MKGRIYVGMKQLTAGLLVLIMSLLMVNRALYTHIHVIPDGSLVSHAHPFSKTTDDPKGKEHQHSSQEFFLLDQLDVLTISACALFVLKAFTRSITVSEGFTDRLLPSLVPITPGRAPPASM